MHPACTIISDTIASGIPPHGAADDGGVPPLEARMQALLIQLLQIPSISGDEAKLTHTIADAARRAGLEVDLWQAREADLLAILPPRHPLHAARHLPLDNRPSLVIRLPGRGGGPNLMFNAHSDVVPPGDVARWTIDPWSGAVLNGRVYGRGACDVKGGLISALWAMLSLAEHGAPLTGDVLLEVVPGEEDCVGLGTLASLARGYRADAAIVLEPTEALPRCASRGGLRFEITATGRAVHGTVKWLGEDAIALGRQVLDALEVLENRWNDRNADPLFSSYPIARPITIDSIHGGVWQGMVCDRCTIAGYLELLPGDDADQWAAAFADALNALVGAGAAVKFSEHYAGHRLSPEHPIFLAAKAAVAHEFPWQAFNSGCEAGLRAGLCGTPTLVWGPGSLAQAHCADEYVEWNQVAAVARCLKDFAARWCNAGHTIGAAAGEF